MVRGGVKLNDYKGKYSKIQRIENRLTMSITKIIKTENKKYEFCIH